MRISCVANAVGVCLHECLNVCAASAHTCADEIC